MLDYQEDDQWQADSAAANRRKGLIYAGTFSALLHLAIILFAPPDSFLPDRDAHTVLRTPLQLVLEKAAIPEITASSTDNADKAVEPREALVPEPEQPAEASSQAPEQKSPTQTQGRKRIDFNALVRETVETMPGNSSYRFEEEGRKPGSSAFDPRLREKIRQSEDINTPPPPKKSSVTSYRDLDGSVYVELGNGSCFRVKESLEAGVPAQWEMTGCKGKTGRLELDPKPYSQVDP